ncbi:MAG: carboxynorspermidine decarboxylase [Bacteroidales bacterium]|nr:carboxynorspermidine decarboxylase [Bacteroidales bacterium]
MTQKDLNTPYYIVYEDALRRNMDTIARVADATGVNIIIALKANALWRTFPILRERFPNATASSLNELQLAHDELGGELHSYTPAYTEGNIQKFLDLSTHLTFNSLSQLERFSEKVKQHNDKTDKSVSIGLRVNPKCSVIETDIYNPAKPGSRFGVAADEMPNKLPEVVEGLHFHALCESSSYDLEKVLAAFEAQFGKYLPRLKWVNFGGGHLMTREGYDTDHLISVLHGFRERYPWLEVIMEPGSAFTWRTGDLEVTVVDIVEHDGISTAIIDASFACHMPDTLEMPYLPDIEQAVDKSKGQYYYRLGGNSCLSGDFKEGWWFKEPLKIGDRLTLKDMNHYTTVKTNMFNGVQHPSIALQHADGQVEMLRKFDYNDYKSRMS